MRAKPRTQQRGQVMPMTIILILAVILALWVLYESGTLMTEKIRLQNTADNVAYSSAALVSRDLNFIAYTNRGMIANQVGIGQMVGLSSWAASMDQFAANIDTVASFFPPAKAASSSLKSGTAGLSSGMDRFADFMIRANSQFAQLLSEAQQVFHVSVIVQLPGLSRDIAHRNDPEAYAMLSVDGYAFAEAASVVEQWQAGIGDQNQRHSVASDDATHRLENRRFRELEQRILDSRDPFTAGRSYKWDYPFSTPEFPGGWETRKYGGSEMSRFVDPDDDRYRWDWTAAETVAVRFILCDLSGCDAEDPGLPLAWGAAHALDEDKTSDLNDYGYSAEWRQEKWWGQGIWRNPLSAALLLTSPASHSVTGGVDHVNHRISDARPLEPFYAFRDEQPIHRGPVITALYAKDSNQIAFQREVMGAGTGAIAAEIDVQREGGLARNRMGALAMAQPYYARPTDLPGFRRRDQRTESGNLFNPYWQPRLIDPSDADKAAAVAMISGLRLSDPAGSPP